MKQGMRDPRLGAVAAVIREYFDGLYHSDTQRLRRVFHPQAVYACAMTEPAVILRMEEYLPTVAQSPSLASRGQTGVGAHSAHQVRRASEGPGQGGMRHPAQHFTDLLTLTSVDGRWQIIA